MRKTDDMYGNVSGCSDCKLGALLVGMTPHSGKLNKSGWKPSEKEFEKGKKKCDDSKL